jgi:hypothetical protein
MKWIYWLSCGEFLYDEINMSFNGIRVQIALTEKL